MKTTLEIFRKKMSLLKMVLIAYLFSFFLSQGSFSQLAPELNYPVLKYNVNTWQASWIKCPDAPEADYGVMLFRKSSLTGLKLSISLTKLLIVWMQ